MNKYNEKYLKKISQHTKKSIDEILETYQDRILFFPENNDRTIGFVFKEGKNADIKLNDIIEVKNAEYIDINATIIGATKNDFDVTKMHISEPKKEKTEKELNSKNILTGITMIIKLFDIDPDSTMEQLKYMNEKIRMRNKLIECGFETKEQRKHAHDALKYCAKNIKSKGSDVAADDTAEKYRIEAKMIKHLRGFHNRLFANPFK